MIVAALAAPWLAKMPALLAVCLDLAVIPLARRLWRWAQGELRQVVWFSEGRWLLLDRERREHSTMCVGPGVFVGAHLVALRFECDCCRRRFRIALLADNSDTEARRRLIVRLRATPDDVLFGMRDQSVDVDQ